MLPTSTKENQLCQCFQQFSSILLLVGQEYAELEIGKPKTEKVQSIFGVIATYIAQVLQIISYWAISEKMQTAGGVEYIFF